MTPLQSFKKWAFTVTGSIVLLVGAVAAVNAVVDAYGILRNDFSRQFQMPNMQYVKIQHLRVRGDAYDSLLFGSSRVENIDVKKIAAGRYYNMTYPAGVPQEHLDNIRYLLNRGMIIKNVMIGLDDFSCVIDPLEHRSDLELQPHPAVSGKKPSVFYAEYFLKLRKFFPQLSAYVRHNYTHRWSPEETRIVYDIHDSGRILCPACDADIERDREAHVNSTIFMRPNHYDGDNTEHALAAMQEIVSLSKSRHFNLIVFINPIHQTTYLDASLPLFSRFKRELAAMTDYYDFSGLNAITTDNYNYYETSHYRPFVGDMMLKVMLGSPNVAVPRDFGFYVTRENVEEHLRSQCREVARFQNKTVMSRAAIDYAKTCDGPGE